MTVLKHSTIIYYKNYKQLTKIFINWLKITFKKVRVPGIITVILVYW